MTILHFETLYFALKMEYKRITTPEDPWFGQCMDLYELSFPYEERRDRCRVEEDLKDSRYHFMAFSMENGNEPSGFIAYWIFPEPEGYIYGEHFAVNPALRRGGIGASVLEHFKSYNLPIILEIELPEDELKTRRMNFYLRNGFIMNPHKHMQPPYHPDSQALPLRVMTWPREFSAEEYERFRTDQIGII